MSLASKLKNQAGRAGNEIGLHVAAAVARTSGHGKPRVLFCPSGEREGASLLRAFNLAEALEARGWRAACISPLLRAGGRKRVIKSFAPDLLVFQQCRHVLNAAEHANGIPYVLDTDDADFLLDVPGLASRLDRTSRNAAGVIAGSRFLRDWHAARCSRTTVIWTGTPVSSGSRRPHAQRVVEDRPVLAWAQAKPLDYTRELNHVAGVATHLRDRGLSFVLRFYGISSAAEAEALARQLPDGIRVETRPPLPYDAFLKSLQEVAVGLSPIIASSPFSRGKSFGKILGYLDAKVPVIASDEADHALFFNGRNGIVSNAMPDWVEGAARLLGDAGARQAMADAAFGDFQARLSLEAAADLTDRFLRRVLADSGQGNGLGLNAASG